MTVAGDVSSALLRSVKPGSDNVTMQAGTLSQVLKKDTAARLSQQLVTLPSAEDGTAITFKLPTLENVTSATYVMGLQVSLDILASFSCFNICVRGLHLHIRTFPIDCYNSRCLHLTNIDVSWFEGSFGECTVY